MCMSTRYLIPLTIDDLNSRDDLSSTLVALAIIIDISLQSHGHLTYSLVEKPYILLLSFVTSLTLSHTHVSEFTMCIEISRC